MGGGGNGPFLMAAAVPGSSPPHNHHQLDSLLPLPSSCSRESNERTTKSWSKPKRPKRVVSSSSSSRPKRVTIRVKITAKRRRRKKKGKKFLTKTSSCSGKSVRVCLSSTDVLGQEKTFLGFAVGIKLEKSQEKIRMKR
jgi:hypothetical protein